MKRWKIRKYYQLKDYIDVLNQNDKSSPFMALIQSLFEQSPYNFWLLTNNNANYKMYPNVFEKPQDATSWRLKSPFDDCWWQIATRFREDIIFGIDEDEDTTANRKSVAIQFFLSLIFVAEQTAEKYTTLLDIYQTEKDKLMDALENITSETHEEESNEDLSQENETSLNGEKSGTSHQDTSSNSEATESTQARTRFSDTPEMAGMYDDDKYTTNLTNGDVDGNSESSAESSADGTTSETNSQTSSTSGNSSAVKEASGKREVLSKVNPMTIMARIKEIDDNYNNIMLKWVNEFERLFLDGANV